MRRTGKDLNSRRIPLRPLSGDQHRHTRPTPELGPAVRTFGPDRTLTTIGFGLAGLLGVLAVLFCIITAAKDPPVPIPQDGRWRFALPGGLIAMTAVALILSTRSWGHRVYLCANGIACRRSKEVVFSLWAELAEVTCSRSESRRLETDRIGIVERNGRRWAIQGRDVREFRALSDALREECERRGVIWKAITIPT